MINNLFRFLKRNYLFVSGFFLVILLLWPLVRAPYFSHHDDVQVIRLFEMNECFRDFQIPCRWDPNLGGLYGYPLFNFYGPLPYYFGELIYLITKSFLLSAKIMFATSFVASYLFMYLFTKKLWGNEKSAVFSALFYAYAPYHALDFYVRGAMGEMWALMFFPVVCWAILRIRENPNYKNLGILGISFGLLVMSHNLSAMIFLPAAVSLTILLYFFEKNKKFITLSLAGILLGLLISAFYWLPAITEKGLVHVETTTFGYFSYTEHFKGLRKLFIERIWGWGASVREIPGGEKDGMSFQIGFVHLLAWISALVVVIVNRKNKFVLWIVSFCSLGILISVFMVHPRSQFVWDLLPPLAYLQFPWRFLMFIIFFISIIAGSLFLFLKNRNSNLVFTFFLVLLLVLNFSYFSPEKFFYLNDKEYLSDTNWDRQIKRSIFDYLPKSAKFPPAELATVKYEILSGTTEVSDYAEGSNWVKFKVVSEQGSTIRLSKYYFPNWKVKIDDKFVNFNYENDLGLITFDLPSGTHIVEAKLYDTPIRTVGNLITLITILIVYFLLKKK